MFKYTITITLFLTLMIVLPAKADPVVLELFTSQSCSSCPPADAILKKLSEADPNVLALSMHVNYWDYLSWKDTYSSVEATQRQHDYFGMRGKDAMFTPELVVNGAASINGSDSGAVNDAIKDAKKIAPQFNVIITPKNNQLAVNIKPLVGAPAIFDVWEISFDHDSLTQVKAGENGGRTLETINNVISIKKLALANPIIIDKPESYRVAIIVQAPNQGRIFGAASYIKN